MKNLFLKTLVFVLVLTGIGGSHLIAQTESTSDINTRTDSLAQDSVARVIASEEVATLVPSYYSTFIVKVNAEILPKLNAANGVVNDPEVYRLQQDFRELSRITDYIIARNNILEGIESLENQWRNNLNQIKTYTEDLKFSTNDLVEMKRNLAEERNEWLSRRSKLAIGTHLDQIQGYVQSSIDTIDFFLGQGASTLDTVTVTYTHLTELQLKTQGYVDELHALRIDRLTSLLTNRGNFIWNERLEAHLDAVRSQTEYLRTVGVEDMRYYIKEHKRGIADTFFFFIIITIIIYWTRRRSLIMDDDEEPEMVRNPHVLRRPMTMSIFVTIIAGTFFLPNKPPLLDYLSSAFILYCIWGILGNMIRNPSRWPAYVLAGLFVMYQFNAFIREDDHLTRWLTLFVSAILFYLLLWIQRNKKRISQLPRRLWEGIYIGLSGPLLVLSILSIASNVIGYGIVSEIINRGIIFTLIFGLLLVAAYQSMGSVIFHFLDTNIAKKSLILREDGRFIFHRVMKILGSIILFLYGYYCLNFFLLWELVANAFNSIWTFGYSFGTVNLTVGDVISVFITVLTFWLFANAVQLTMRREIFPRFNLPRGVGNAVASITHYSLIVLGIFMALAAAGFELKHLGLLVGALGVGIGFGLQTIINNFLSGLILIFERPITVDDVIEVDGTLGVVTSIGIRASRIRQYNGDEMIVPNADLISKKVTNRTLSDTKRRYTMNFETGRDADTDRVIAIISAAAQTAEGILSDPPAKGYFKGMGEQSLKFYVNYWGAGNFLDLMSGVEQAVYAALEREGIKMPIPVQVEIQKKDKK